MKCEDVSTADDCVKALGCTWKDDDGTTKTAEWGTCEGTAAPCSTFTDSGQCNSQSGLEMPDYNSLPSCTWGTTYGPACEKKAETSCSAYTTMLPQTWPTDGYFVHPITKKAQCEGRKGCTWKAQ